MNHLAELTKFAKRYTEAWCSQNPVRVAAFFAENGSLTVNDWPPVTGAGTSVNDARPGSMVTGSDALTPSTVATSVVCTALVTSAVFTST